VNMIVLSEIFFRFVIHRLLLFFKSKIQLLGFHCQIAGILRFLWLIASIGLFVLRKLGGYDDLDILDSVLKLRDKRAFLVIPPFDSLRRLWLFDKTENWFETMHHIIGTTQNT